MKINEILKSKGHDVATINQNEKVCTAIKTFKNKRIGSLMVFDDSGKISGIITEHDIIRCNPDEEDIFDKKISALMTPFSELIIVTPDDTVQYAMSIMTNERIKHLPVMNGDKLAGMMSIGDAVKSLLEQSQRETKRLQDYISGKYPAE